MFVLREMVKDSERERREKSFYSQEMILCPVGVLGWVDFLFFRVFANVRNYTFLSLSLSCLLVCLFRSCSIFYISSLVVFLFFPLSFPLACLCVGVSHFRSWTHAQTVHRIPWFETGQYPAGRTWPRSHLGSGIGVRFLQEEATRQCVSDFFSYFFTL